MTARITFSLLILLFLTARADASVDGAQINQLSSPDGMIEVSVLGADSLNDITSKVLRAQVGGIESVVLSNNSSSSSTTLLQASPSPPRKGSLTAEGPIVLPSISSQPWTPGASDNEGEGKEEQRTEYVQVVIDEEKPLHPGELPRLVGLVAHLPPRSQTAAYQWCVESDTWSVAVIVELGQEEAILAALGLKPGGNSELIVRKRLSNFRA